MESSAAPVRPPRLGPRLTVPEVPPEYARPTEPFRRPLPTVTYLGTAIDYLVHTQDIAVPLGRSIPMPVPTAVVAADRVWSSGRMFHARWRFSGYRFVATDVDWSAGQGALVTGPISGLLMLLTGRPAGLATLSGPGAQALQTAVSGTRR